MELYELKEHYRTYTKMAKELDLGLSTYQFWLKIGYIPFKTQCLIEKKTKRKFLARKSDLEGE